MKCDGIVVRMGMANVGTIPWNMNCDDTFRYFENFANLLIKYCVQAVKH